MANSESSMLLNLKEEEIEKLVHEILDKKVCDFIEYEYLYNIIKNKNNLKSFENIKAIVNSNKELKTGFSQFKGENEANIKNIQENIKERYESTEEKSNTYEEAVLTIGGIIALLGISLLFNRDN